MTKTTQGQSVLGENKKRLQEIALVQLGALSDDEILRFLAERKRLSAVEREYEKEEAIRLEQERKEEENLKVVEKKKTETLKKIEELNKSISPEKPDDDLLAFVAKRKELEKELEELGGGVLLKEEGPKANIHVAALEEEKKIPAEVSPPVSTIRVEEEYGNEKIANNGIEGGSIFQRYFDQLKNNVGSLGTLLQDMPLDAKKNKAFMLKVAEIDPAYAMHFADKETLKKDEDFNLRIAAFDNPRNSGNAIAEMLPEARTAKVLLVAVKQDYRNIRFVQPNMAGYDEMIERAKKGTLQKVGELKEATNVLTLIPKLLQQDKQFMLQVKEITESKKEE